MSALLQLRLYGRAWCHLCDDLRAALEPLLLEYGAQVTVIDIDTDAALEARFNEWVPVLMLGEVELSRHRLDPERVRHALQAARSGSPTSTRVG